MDGVSEASTDIGSCIPGFLYSCGYLGETDCVGAAINQDLSAAISERGSKGYV